MFLVSSIELWLVEASLIVTALIVYSMIPVTMYLRAKIQEAAAAAEAARDRADRGVALGQTAIDMATRAWLHALRIPLPEGVEFYSVERLGEYASLTVDISPDPSGKPEHTIFWVELSVRQGSAATVTKGLYLLLGEKGCIEPPHPGQSRWGARGYVETGSEIRFGSFWPQRTVRHAQADPELRRDTISELRRLS